MNSPQLAVKRLEEIVSESKNAVTLTDRAALYASARFLLGDIEAHAKVEQKCDGYLREKIGASRWHIAAALGFDIDNGHEAGKHRSWAYGDLCTLSDLVDERFPEDE